MYRWTVTFYDKDVVLQTVEVREGAVIVGADAGCGLIVEAAGMAPLHAELWIGTEGLKVEDLGSDSGTMVNGYAISSRVEVPYPATVQTGSVVFVVGVERLEDVPDIDSGGPQGEAVSGAEDVAVLQGEMGNAPVRMEYALRREIARGGMGQIYEGTDPLLSRQVAVKVSSVSQDGRDLRFTKEAKILAHLAHPNIVPIYAIGSDELDRPFYSMKLVKGRTLQAIIGGLRDNEPETCLLYSRDRLLTVFHKILDAMAFAHSKGVLHRDLKPENIMVGEYGEVLVMDWGLAKILGETEEVLAPVTDSGGFDELGRTMDGAVLGTPQYMSPEQAEGMVSDLDVRSDIYALGAILYAILTLRPPVEGGSLEEILSKVKEGNITSMERQQPTQTAGTELSRPVALGRGVPEALKAVTLKAMARVREDRYQDADAFIADLEAYQHGFATSAEGASLLRRFILAAKRNKTLTVAALLIVGLTVGFMGRVIASEKKAQLSIERLRETAPTFASNARALVENAANDQTALQEALKNVLYAVELDPASVDYKMLQAKILQTLQQFDAARILFAEVLVEEPDNVESKTNLGICEQFLPEQKNGEKLSNASLLKFATALRLQNRQAEALYLTRDSRAAGEGNLAALRAALLKAGVIKGPPPMITDEGNLKLVLVSDRVDDLRFLRGIPVNEIHFHNGKNIKDFSTLSSLPLKSLFFDQFTNIEDLSVLRGLPLKKLTVSSLVKDLSGLEGLALEEFTQYAAGPNSVATQDYGPLKGMPLRILELGRGARINDLSIFKEAPLKSLRVQETSCGNMEALGNMGLESLDIRSLQVPVIQDLQFLKAHKTLRVLRGSGNKMLKDISQLAGVPIRELYLGDTQVSDVSCLAGGMVETLDLQNTPFTEVNQLKKLPHLTTLGLDGTAVKDLGPLADLKLHTLTLSGCRNLGSLAPLSRMTALRTLLLPVWVQDVEALRSLKNLGQISFGTRFFNDDQFLGRIQRVRDFWKMVDAEKQARQAEPGRRLRPSKFPMMAERFPGARAQNGHWYYYMAGRFNWSQAKAICEVLGGHLATVTSMEEYNFTRGYLNGILRPGEACWLGAQADKPRGTFKWVSGEPWGFTHWGRPSEPAAADDFGNPATVLVFAEYQRLSGTPNFCAVAPENVSAAGFLVEWED
jgi:serine/threonine protein kinase